MQNNLSTNIKKTVLNNKVVILFVVLCVATIIVSGLPLTFVANELFVRIGRNGFIVLALIIPVLAGMGLNFGITIGAIAAQIALFWVVYWGFTGIGGFLLAVLMSTPIAILFGYLVGRLFNRMKGSEMIGGMVLGFFVDGLYQLLFLCVIGGIIPVNNPTLIISSGVGVKNTIDLANNLKYALDTVSALSIIQIWFYISAVVMIIKLIISAANRNFDIKKIFEGFIASAVVFAATFIPPLHNFLAVDRFLLLYVVYILLAVVLIKQLYLLLSNKKMEKNKSVQATFNKKRCIALIISYVICLALTFVGPIRDILLYVRIPVTTYLCIALLCGFNNILLKTRLGQNMRTVGQNRVVANSAGINVDRTRIIAMILSTVLACWGQLIYLQNIGTFSTYGAHTQVAQFAIAALLVGGASVQSASNKQALIGIVLFHTLFIAAPMAGKQLFNNPQLGEYFRVFVSYGVIAVSLAMYAWKTAVKPKDRLPQADDSKAKAA